MTLPDYQVKITDASETVHDVTGDVEKLTVTNTIAQQADSFDITLFDPDNTYGSTFKPGNKVEIWTAYLGNTLVKRITGILRTVNSKKVNRKQLLILLGEDYRAQLSNIRVAEKYVSQEISDIVKDLMTKYTPFLTTTNVQTTTTTIDKITFKYKKLSECLNELATTARYEWYVNPDLDLNFYNAITTYSEIELTDDNKNIVKDSGLRWDKSQMRNRVWVQGGLDADGNIVFRESCDYSSYKKYGNMWYDDFIYDEKITDENLAQDLVDAMVQKYAYARLCGALVVSETELKPGENVRIKIAKRGIDEYCMCKSVTHTITKGKYTVKVDVGERMGEVDYVLANIMRKIDSLEQSRIDTETSILVKMPILTDTLTLTPTLEKHKRAINDSFCLGHPVNSEIGAGASYPLGDRTGAWEGT